MLEGLNKMLNFDSKSSRGNPVIVRLSPPAPSFFYSFHFLDFSSQNSCLKVMLCFKKINQPYLKRR
ncbi:MAG: hypothetical protein CMH78_00985 [Nitrospinae bacterium]|nr:hypothetical protein [Nitrospinota bacterium]